MQWTLPVALVALLLAGCSSPQGAPATAQETFDEEVEVHVTATTGAIRGVVVDEAIRPLGGAQVTLMRADGDLQANTTDSGSFSFSDLDPGTYFVAAVKAGFHQMQTSAEVVAGDAEPPILRIQLQRDASQVAYHYAQSQTGYIMCTTAAAAVCGGPNLVVDLMLCPVFQVCPGPVTPDRFGLHFYFDPNATFVQAEMVWDSTQPVSPDLTLSAESLGASTEECPPLTDPLAGAPYTEYASGGTPLLIQTNQTELERGSIGGTCPIFYSVFSGDLQGAPVGFTVQQAFEVFVDAFHGYTPADVGMEGWRLSEDGEAPPPPQ